VLDIYLGHKLMFCSYKEFRTLTIRSYVNVKKHLTASVSHESGMEEITRVPI